MTVPERWIYENTGTLKVNNMEHMDHSFASRMEYEHKKKKERMKRKMLHELDDEED